jgi:hypothetical protein
MTWEAYQNAYHAADEATRALVDGDKIPRCVATSVENRSLDASHQRLLVQLMTHHTLAILSFDELVKQLQQAGVPNSTVTANELIACIGHTKATATAIPSAETTPSAGTAEPEPAKEDLHSEIQETEADLQAIPKIRTMEADMRGQPPSEPTHQSSQEDILQKPKSS